MINPKRGTISHITGKFDFVKFLEYLEKFQVTSLNCVPPIMVALAKHPAVEKFDLTAIRSIGCGAAPLSYDIMKEVTARVGRGKYLSVNQGWGMTEATCSVLSRHPDDDSEGSTVGELLPNCEAKVVDAETGTRDLPANVSGEVWIRAPNVCKGYYNNPKATAEIFTPDGWMRTGDIGYYDEHGKWYIIDRIKVRPTTHHSRGGTDHSKKGTHQGPRPAGRTGGAGGHSARAPGSGRRRSDWAVVGGR